MGKSHFFEKKLGKCLFRIIIFLIFRLQVQSNSATE